MVEPMYEQSPEFLKKFRKNLKFFILNNEPDASQLPLNTNFAFATHSIHNESCAQLLDNDPPHIHVLIKVTKDDFNHFRCTLFTLILQTSDFVLQ